MWRASISLLLPLLAAAIERPSLPVMAGAAILLLSLATLLLLRFLYLARKDE